MKLRPYQEQAIAKARREFETGGKAVLVVSPTGSGKTVMLAHVAQAHIQADPSRRVVVLVHRRELVEQTFGKLLAFGVPSGRVLVHTVQSLLTKSPPNASMLILDEAHHYVSEEWGRVAATFAGAPTIGLTATPERGDGKGLGHIFDRMVVVAQPRELVDAGALVECDVIAPKRRLQGGKIAQSPASAYLTHGNGASAIVFSPTVAIAHQHCDEFRASGVDAAVVWGAMATEAREDAIQRFRDRKLQVLVNCMVLTEGFDAPHAGVCILARGTGTTGAFLQMAGRVLRPHPVKQRAVLIDLVGASIDHGTPLDDREYSLEDGFVKQQQAASEHSFCPACGATWSPPKCDGCGHESESITQTVTGDKLVKYERKRAEGDEARALTLARWIRDGRTKHYKPGWALAKYSAVYGERPRPNILDAALYVAGIS